MNQLPKIYPIRQPEPAEIVCMVHGKQTIDKRKIKWFDCVRTDNGVTAVIHMESGESYYIAGKDHHQVAEELGFAGLTTL